MTGIYLSGTGNTKHCVERLLQGLDKNAASIPIESGEAVQAIEKDDLIVLGYPTQYSNAPMMVRDFIHSHAALWKGKKVFCLVTMGLFSGDGAGCSARILKKYGAEIVGGLHLQMPDSVCDVGALKKSVDKNHELVVKADAKIDRTVEEIRNNQYPKDGLGFLPHLGGLFGQRLWFWNKTKDYSSKLKISDACIGCGQCAKNCPMQNLIMKEGRPVAQNRCTMCYRCISTCPKQAITLLGKEVKEQCHFEKYQ